MKTERFEFIGHSGAQLAARLDFPTGKPAAFALFAHCFTCSKDLPAARRIAQRLASLGIAVLRFDFTGLGHSSGDFASTNFSSNVADLKLAADYLRQHHKAPSLLIGHSLGGAAILAVAEQIPESKAVITLGAPSTPAHVVANFADDVEQIEEHGNAQVQLGGRSFRIEQQFIDDVTQQNLQTQVSSLNKALLVLHAPLDKTVALENAAQLFQWAKHPKSFITLDNADHLLSHPEDAHYVADLITTWVQRYIHVNLLPKAMHAPEGTVRVSEVNAQGFLQDISAAGHHLQADEPIEMGGTFLGPTPYQLVSAGLGACTSMTIRMYAKRKNIPLEHVEVEIYHAKVHATDCTNCEPKNAGENSAKLDQFSREIRLRGNLTAEQKQRLLAIADRCPVHRSLEGKIAITTALVS